jgi:DNA-binding LacI/PurR family transcriptional regulator
MGRATIDDVARRAGVTKSTVSHALSGKRPVSPETRQRIEDAISALRYRPNPVAQRLAAGRAGALGFVYELVPSSRGDALAVLAAAGAAASAAGFALILFAGEGGSAEQIEPFLESGLLDGVVLGQVRMQDARVAALCRAGTPFVMLGRTADNNGLSYVDIDIEAAVESAVEHLAGLGHQRVAFLHEDAQASAAASRGLQAYERACVRRRWRLHAPTCSPSVAGGETAASRLLEQAHDITALIVSGDAVAWGAKAALQDLGRSVPDDMSFVCLGKTSVSDLFRPEVTALDLRPAEQAEQAIGMLLELLDEQVPDDRQVLLEPVLVPGLTTATPPGQSTLTGSI